VAHYNLGRILKDIGRYEEALASYENALRVQPGYERAHEGLGVLLNELGDYDKAISRFRKALLLAPESPRTLNNLGIAFQNLGRIKEAISIFSEALEFDPGLAAAHNNLGNALEDLGKSREAVASYHKALQIAPGYADAHYNLGNVLAKLGKLDVALSAYTSALQIKPDDGKTYNSLGNLLMLIGQFPEARASYRKALQIRPDDLAAHSNILRALLYEPDMEATLLKQEAKKWWEAHGKGLTQRRIGAEFDIRRDRPLRIGLISPNFGMHPVGLLTIKLIENADHIDMQFNCYSDRSESDEYTERFKKSAELWKDTKGLSDKELSDVIQQDRIDILFDLSGHTSNNRLMVFAMKPAPVQVAWHSPGTRGLPTIDYMLADRFHVPKSHEDQYLETVIRMRKGYACFDPPGWSLPVTPLPALRNGFITFGCFNNPMKINDKIIEKWAGILKQLPTSKLVLKYSGMDAEHNKKRILSTFTGQGVDEFRITFEGKVPRKELLGRYGDIDIALDTLPYSGGVITCEALWMGVPVVTAPGKTFAGRHSFSHLSNVGYTGSIAQDLDCYVDTAVLLASDLKALAGIRSSLREKMLASPLCDGPGFATDFGVLMRKLWENYVDTAEPVPLG
jgi:predicted O-linked N-acetylglucosamine transferase (SPINDLY family)